MILLQLTVSFHAPMGRAHGGETAASKSKEPMLPVGYQKTNMAGRWLRDGRGWLAKASGIDRVA